jgi:dUTP pyrophosphatase
MELAVRRLSESATLPSRANEDDAGLDLYAAEPATLAPGERASVGTGIALEIP